MGELKPFRMEQLALALKEELDVTLLRAQKAGQIFRLINGQTQQRMKNGAIAVAPHDAPIEVFLPEEKKAQVPENQDILPLAKRADEASLPTPADKTMIDPLPAAPAKPSATPSETPTAMAA